MSPTRVWAAGDTSIICPGSAPRKAGGTRFSAAAEGGESAKPRLSSASAITMRSHQPASARVSWRIGSASRNSLATRIMGPSGTPASSLCQLGRNAARRSAWRFLKAGLTSTRWISALSTKPGAIWAARSMSAIMVPRPGPSSTKRKGAGAPIRRQISVHQRPNSSPNIWLISGAVVKSPDRPNGSPVM